MRPTFSETLREWEILRSRRINSGLFELLTSSELCGFRSKYGNLEKRAGSNLLRKKLQPNGRKYFDSGDYNMKKESMKPSVRISIPGNCHSTDRNMIIASKLEMKKTSRLIARKFLVGTANYKYSYLAKLSTKFFRAADRGTSTRTHP